MGLGKQPWIKESTGSLAGCDVEVDKSKVLVLVNITSGTAREFTWTWYRIMTSQSSAMSTLTHTCIEATSTTPLGSAIRKYKDMAIAPSRHMRHVDIKAAGKTRPRTYTQCYRTHLHIQTSPARH